MSEERRSFAKEAVAGPIRQWLDERIAEVDHGDIARARSGLEASRWWDWLESAHVPLYPLIRLGELVELAADHLADRAFDPGQARRTLQSARALVAVPGAS